MTDRSTYRCAVYTRKSHEDGLDQDFNSLDAQAEACRAYIASQAGLGWSLRDKAYDDGGISGGHLERPALQALIADVKAGLIDVIVVYKVDRLTRSLTDFSKLVDVFDAHDVSFVSVTQAFNTTTSMGRLTLNVLLSFAQFEREVTAERIRDKIAASKAKGMWMGGAVPLGYRNEDRKLFIREDEAKLIRWVFELYLTHKNVRLVKAKLDEQQIVTRVRQSKSGRRSGGCSFSRGRIYRILTNPIYIGQIQHKDRIYDGEHAAIIDKGTWDAVQAALKDNASNRARIGNSKSPALLAGLIYDKDGQKLVPHHANKKGTHYHYYVSQRLKTGDQDSGWRIPMKTLEAAVRKILTTTFESDQTLLSLLKQEQSSAEHIASLSNKAKALAGQIRIADAPTHKALYNHLISKITLKSGEIIITLKSAYLGEQLETALNPDVSYSIPAPLHIKRRAQEMKLVIGGDETSTNKDHALIKLIAKAHLLKTELETGSVSSIKDFAAQHNLDHADAKRMLPLGYLAPDIMESIFTGTHPAEPTALQLKNGYDLPKLWSEQRAFLGFAST